MSVLESDACVLVDHDSGKPVTISQLLGMPIDDDGVYFFVDWSAAYEFRRQYRLFAKKNVPWVIWDAEDIPSVSEYLTKVWKEGYVHCKEEVDSGGD